MTEATFWWILSGVAVGVEMLTGTFYLLMLSIGLTAGAIGAHLGASLTQQILLAAVIGGASIVAWRSYKKTQPTPPASANHDVNLDIGELVQVEQWESSNNTHVKYHGAQWLVELAPGETAATGAYRIIEVIGSRLLVKKA